MRAIGSMTARLNPLAFGTASGAVLGLGMLVFSLIAGTGRAAEAEQWMEAMHAFYGLNPLGVIAGIIESALFGFAMGAPLAWTYNRLSRPDR